MITHTYIQRLPIVQGGSFPLLAPAFAILSLEKWKCPQMASNNFQHVRGNISQNGTELIVPGSSEHREVWTTRIAEIQGAIILANFVQILIGITGGIGLLLRFIGPLTVTPIITLMALSLFNAASSQCAAHWWIALLTMCFLIVFSQYLRNVEVPFCSLKDGRCRKSPLQVFTMVPVILAIFLAWIVCAILTATGALPTNPDAWGYKARTDIKLDVLYQTPWFRFPYPFYWGLPTFGAASTLGMVAGVLASIIKSTGDYYICARVAGVSSPPSHAVNRGILMQGVGCILAACWGTAIGTISYSQNIGTIAITKVSSMRVIQVSSLIMIVFGLLGKFGAVFVTIPDPIIGGVLMTILGLIVAVGLADLQFVNLNSTRNLFIVGFSILFGFALPQWVAADSTRIKTGSDVVDQLLTVLLTTSMFVGGAVGFFLDNTIPGTQEERGIQQWRGRSSKSESNLDCYQISCCNGLLERLTFTRYIPICPTFLKHREKQDNNVS